MIFFNKILSKIFSKILFRHVTAGNVRSYNVRIRGKETADGNANWKIPSLGTVGLNLHESAQKFSAHFKRIPD